MDIDKENSNHLLIWYMQVYNSKSFQIFADAIVNSSMFKSRDFTKKRLKIPKGNPNPYIEE
jgi:hypothetical protein